MRARTRSALLILLAAAPLAAGSCVGAFFRQPVNVEATRDEVEAMRREQSEILTVMRELKARLDDQGETTASLRADSNSQLRALEERVEALRVLLEDQGARIDRGLRRMEEARAAVAAPLPADTGQAVRPGPRSGVSETELYDLAYRDYSRGNYQLAVAGFQEFLRAYPASDRADNAQYWLGECRFALGDLDGAVQEFLKVRDLYPQGNKACAATLKIGYAYLRQGDNPAARRYFESVTRECPATDEARLAADKLAAMR